MRKRSPSQLRLGDDTLRCHAHIEPLGAVLRWVRLFDNSGTMALSAGPSRTINRNLCDYIGHRPNHRSSGALVSSDLCGFFVSDRGPLGMSALGQKQTLFTQHE